MHKFNFTKVNNFILLLSTSISQFVIWEGGGGGGVKIGKMVKTCSFQILGLKCCHLSQNWHFFGKSENLSKSLMIVKKPQ